MPDARHLRSRRATTQPSLVESRLEGDLVTVTVSPAARTMRRQLGPAAWALEDVLCDITMDTSGRATAQTSVRRVAAGVGVSTDTAARALARLIDVGLLCRRDFIRADDGTFTTGSYEVLVDQLDGVTVEPHLIAPEAAAEVSRRRRGNRQHQQPALFNLDEARREAALERGSGSPAPRSRTRGRADRGAPEPRARNRGSRERRAGRERTRTVQTLAP
jgi:hypothetical protein